MNKEGDFVLGEKGPIRLKANNFTVDQDGNVWQNGDLAGDPRRLVSPEENDWQARVPMLLEEFRRLSKGGESMATGQADAA